MEAVSYTHLDVYKRQGFMDTMNAPSPNIMNKLQRCVLGLYSYDEHAEDLSLENILSQMCIRDRIWCGYKKKSE